MHNDVKQLTKDLASGSEEAYKTLFYMYYARVRAFALGMLKNADDADDLAQTVLARIWVKREVFAKVENFDSYLFRLSKNAILNVIAAQNAVFADVNEATAELPSSHSYNPESQVMVNDTTVIVETAVNAMPRQRQEVYRLSRQQMLTNEEIAVRLGLSKKTVENHINLALKDIRLALKC